MFRRGGTVASSGRRSIRGGDVGRLVVAWLTGTAALMISAGLLDGLSSTTPWAYAVVALVAGLAGLVIRPLLVEATARIGWMAVLPIALVGQALILYGAMLLVPAITTTFGDAFVA